MSAQMNKALLAELMELTPAERIELAEELWDSISPEEMPPLTDEQQEIERRLAEHARDPSRASTWEAVGARLWARFG
jgi:putative addiction module component (TIGR02574 family)